MCAYLHDFGAERGGFGKLEHFRRVITAAWPKTDWNPWLDRFVDTFVHHDWICFSGCASSGKTFGSALTAVAWWLCAPERSSVICSSTTRQMLRKRIWGVIQELYRSSTIGPFGNFVDSKTMWQSQKGDDKHAIFAIAVEDGSINKAIDRIKGVHTERQLVIIDEATSVPEAIFETAANLYAGAREFKCIVMGNPRSRLDSMGRFMEPDRGYSSVTVDDDEWFTVPQLNGSKGICVRFDAEKSPNILVGQEKWPYLVTERRLNNARNRLGAESPRFYTEYRGYPPTEGLLKTVFTEGLLETHKALGNPHEFTGDWFIDVAGFDPAFGGGDRPIMKFGRIGRTTKGNMGMNLGDTVKLEINAQTLDKEPLHYQLARQAVEQCEARKVLPECLAVDATGEGGGLCDIIQRKWGPIIRVEFGGRAGEEPINAEDRRPAIEVYQNKAAAIWFSTKEYLISGQLKNFDSATAMEFTEREYDDSGLRIKLKSKAETKLTFGKSPDLADATVLAVEAGRIAGMSLDGIGESVGNREKEWSLAVERSESVYADPTDDF